jgi:hypothetical protein
MATRTARTAGNGALPWRFAAVLIERGNTDESGDAPAGEQAEFGLRWYRPAGQFGGLDKLGSGCH